MKIHLAAATAGIAALAGSSSAQDRAPLWSAGIGFQGPVPAERSLGAHAARVLASGAAWSVGLEGAIATSAGTQVTKVCLLSPNTPCDTRELGQAAELKAFGSVRLPGPPRFLMPHALTAVGLYASRWAGGAAWNGQGTKIHDGKGLGPAGLVVEGGAGLTLIPGRNPLAAEVLVRKYRGAPRPRWNTYVIRLSLGW